MTERYVSPWAGEPEYQDPPRGLEDGQSGNEAGSVTIHHSDGSTERFSENHIRVKVDTFGDAEPLAADLRWGGMDAGFNGEGLREFIELQNPGDRQ